MTVPRERLSKWIPFAASTALQICGFIWYAASVGSQVTQNTKDIAEMRMILVPRPEIEAERQAVNTRLSDINSKLDILLSRTSHP